VQSMLLILLLLPPLLLPLPFYDHSTGQPVLAAPSVKNWMILLKFFLMVLPAPPINVDNPSQAVTDDMAS